MSGYEQNIDIREVFSNDCPISVMKNSVTSILEDNNLAVSIGKRFEVKRIIDISTSRRIDTAHAGVPQIFSQYEFVICYRPG
jgi:hypothetical protein